MSNTQTSTVDEEKTGASVPSILYLSGAPRLSTRPNTESLGPRSHILGVIGAFRSMGADVRTFIVGDSTPESMHGEGSESRMGSSTIRLVAADIGRLLYRARSRNRLRRIVRSESLRPVAYERYALMQELGSVPQKKGAFWILEVNALLAIEATSERRATFSRRVASWFERRTLCSADLIVAVTDNLARAICETYKIPRDRVVTIENGVDVTGHALSDGSPAALPTIGFLGSLYRWQRVDQLIQAIADDKRNTWHLRIAGSGAELENLKQQTSSLGLDDRVTFLGRIHPDAVPAFLQSVDVCYAGHDSANGVYFSPLKLWEYLAAGRVVLASRHQTTARLQQQGFPVICFDEQFHLGDALSSIDEDRQRLLALAAKSQHAIWEQYSWEARVRPLLDRLKGFA